MKKKNEHTRAYVVCMFKIICVEIDTTYKPELSGDITTSTFANGEIHLNTDDLIRFFFLFNGNASRTGKEEFFFVYFTLLLVQIETFYNLKQYTNANSSNTYTEEKEEEEEFRT